MNEEFFRQQLHRERERATVTSMQLGRAERLLERLGWVLNEDGEYVEKDNDND